MRVYVLQKIIPMSEGDTRIMGYTVDFEIVQQFLAHSPSHTYIVHDLVQAIWELPTP